MRKSVSMCRSVGRGGERAFMRDQSVTTITLCGPDNKILPDTTYDPAQPVGQPWRREKHYVYRNCLLLTSVSATSGVVHYALDHLGSPRLLTDRCGERIRFLATKPFGQDPDGTTQSSERMRFTIHERDLEMLDNRDDDLDYMHARTYWPVIGRLLSVDPGKDWDPGTPNSWNMYMYVRDNPLNAVDPTGRMIRLWVVFPVGGFISGFGSSIAFSLAAHEPINLTNAIADGVAGAAQFTVLRYVKSLPLGTGPAVA